MDIVCRLAVPFFAVCSGYFLSKSLAKNEFRAKPIKKQEWKMIKLYALWTLLYLLYSIPTWIKTGWMSFGAFKDYALATVTQGCHYHLWYLISLIYALPLFYLCARFIKNRKLLFVLMIALYIIKAISYGYARWLPTFIQTIFGIGTKLSALVGTIFGLAAILAPRFLMKIFTNDEALIFAGAEYLHIVGVSYFLLSFSQIIQATLKSIERTKIVTVITTAALLLNICLNAVFIFGLFGAPKMGIRGVALATTIARVMELALSVFVIYRSKEIKVRPECLFRRNALLLRDFVKYSLPAIGNEVVWGAGFASYAVIMGHLGSDLVAANSLVNVLRNLATIVCFGMAYGGAILVGKEIGAGQNEKAKRSASRLVKSTIFAGVIGAAALIASQPLLFKMAKLTEEATKMLSPLLYINALSIVGATINTVLICGVFRSGGDAKFGFVLDTIAMWAVSVPLGMVAAFVLHLPPLVVYLILYLDEFEKMPVNIFHYKSGKWLKNITRDF